MLNNEAKNQGRLSNRTKALFVGLGGIAHLSELFNIQSMLYEYKLAHNPSRYLKSSAVD
jgi:hypothetical protein